MAKIILELYIVLMAVSGFVSAQIQSKASSDLVKPLQKIIFTNEQQLFVGATDTLYTIDPSTLTVNTSLPIYNVTEDTNAKLPIINYLGTYGASQLILCSSYRGLCEIRNRTAGGKVGSVVSSGIKLVTSQTNGSVILVSSQYPGIGEALWVISSQSKETKPIALAIRNLTNFEYLVDTASLAVTGYQSNLVYYGFTAVTWQFVYGFKVPGYVFYVRNDGGKAYIGVMCDNDDRFNTLVEFPLGCTSTSSVPREFIQAATSSEVGSLLHFDIFGNTENGYTGSKQVLFAVFGRDSSSSSTSICAYSVQSLIDTAKGVFSRCHIDGITDVDIGPPALTPSSLDCSPITALANNKTLTPCQIIKLSSFSRKESYSPLTSAVRITKSSRVDLTFPVNAMAVKVVGVFTVAFTTSPAGLINKVTLAGNPRRGVYDTEDLSLLMNNGTTSSETMVLLPEIAIGDNVIYALTSKRVLSTPIHQCNLASSCDKCSDLGDPYCGWCTLSNRCSIRSECNKASSSSLKGHWLKEYSGSSDTTCITPSVEEPNISLQKLTVNNDPLIVKFNQIPEIEGEERYYCCLFSDIEQEMCQPGLKKTERLGGLSDSDRTPFIECFSPEVSKIQSLIPVNKDHIITNLVLKIDNIQFAELNLTFYNCSRHTSCTSCATANSAFSCKWCLSSHKCFESTSTSTSASTCAGSAVSNGIQLVGTLIGEKYCPRIQAFYESPAILVPAETTPADIKFKLYSKQPDVEGYTCELMWDGTETKSYPAVVVAASNYDILECKPPRGEKISYAGKESTKIVDVKIKLLNVDAYLDNPSKAHVEMYKCKEMKGTCSECLGSVDSKYRCGWCQKKHECQVATHCSTLLDSDQDSCPDIEIGSISPANGPIDGHTHITINGFNLGKSYNQIEGGISIRRGQDEVPCVLNDTRPHVPSKVFCFTSNTSIAGSGPVKVVIRDEDGLDAESPTDFSFLVPKVTHLSAIKGPLSGGSRISIIGRNINIGSSRRVTMKLKNFTVVECELEASNTNITNEIVFITPPVNTPQFVLGISLFVDAFSVDHINPDPTKTEFSFLTDSTVTGLNTYKGIISGGTNVTVTGTSFSLINEPRMYLKPLSGGGRARRAVDQNQQLRFPCYGLSNERITCELPRIPKSWPVDSNNTVKCNYGFILDGIKSTLDLALREDAESFQIGVNPTFDEFGEITPIENLKIEGKHLLLIGPQEIVKPMVKVQLFGIDKGSGGNSQEECVVTTIQNELLYCDMPDLQSSKTYTVTVLYGSVVSQKVGTILPALSPHLPQAAIIGIGVGCGVFVIVIIIIIVVLKCRLSQTDQGMKKLQDKMDNLEMTVAKECKEAFTELQTDMTEMTADIQSLHGLPFYEYNHYCMRVLFPPLQSEYDHPVMRKLEIGDERDRAEQGIREFGVLVNNKTFLLTFIRTLEQQRKLTVRDRVEIGSLISVALQPRMEYHTDILKTLLAELIERTMDTKKDPKILLRRNESVAEKMLSNWFAFLLQKFLKECAGEPLYLLFRAIKQQVDKGPVDAVTADAKYSLSEDKLLRQIVECRPITLRFCSPDPHAVQDPQTVKVLDCDTISQAIDKILDTLYRNVPNTTKPARDRLTLEWLKPSGDRVAMSDDDPAFSKVESDSCKRLVTLQCYKITDNAMVGLTPKHPHMDSKSSLPKYDTNSSNGNYHGSAAGDSLSRANSANNILEPSAVGAKQRLLRYHLMKPSEADVHQEGDRNKMVSEIYLTRLLATKGTLQQFVDDLFETIFSTSHRGSALPLAIKYMFDFLDDQALLHNIGNADVIHHWKSNSLPLRFWVNVIKNPDFVFDIHKSNIVDACLSVVAQIFMDSCSLSEHRLGKESPSSKLLYAKDIPKYRKWVDRYYSDIKSMPAISDHEMAAVLAEESRQHRNEFNNSAAMYELYKYVQAYETEVMNALKEDEFARKDRLAERLELVKSLLNSVRII